MRCRLLVPIKFTTLFLFTLRVRLEGPVAIKFWILGKLYFHSLYSLHRVCLTNNHCSAFEQYCAVVVNSGIDFLKPFGFLNSVYTTQTQLGLQVSRPGIIYKSVGLALFTGQSTDMALFTSDVSRTDIVYKSVELALSTSQWN